jgi:hypothetical protein
MMSVGKNFFFAPLRLCGKYFSTPRARNDYSTHVPILIGLARLREIRTVLEFGCGYYSTLTFLNRTAFPDLERLQSVENDLEWAETMTEVAKDDRWTLNHIDGEVADSVATLDPEAFDLILIDDSKTSAQRSSTIRAIANKHPQRPWIAIHDYEVAEYQGAARVFKHRYAFKAYNPHTGLVCNRIVPGARELDRLIKENKTLEPDDLPGWLNRIL